MGINAMGHQSLLAMDVETPIDTNSEPYFFLSESLVRKQAHIDTDELSGSRSRTEERTREGQEDVSGTLNMIARPGYFDNILPRLGMETSGGGVYTLTEEVPLFPILIDRVVDAYLYEGCFISRMALRGSAGGPVFMDLDILAKSETKGQTFPSITHPVTLPYDPYVFTDGVMTLQSGARTFRDFELIWDNVGEADFRNSVEATSIDATDRLITLRANVGWDSTNETSLHDQAKAGAAGTLVFTNGDVSTQFAFATLQVPTVTPNVPSRSHIPFNLEMTARMTGSTREVIVTNDATV